MPKGVEQTPDTVSAECLDAVGNSLMPKGVDQNQNTVSAECLDGLCSMCCYGGCTCRCHALEQLEQLGQAE